MSAWLGILIVVATNAAAVAVMLAVRARAPLGGYYDDTQQAGWVYSVAGTSFAVILAFVFLLAFQSFDRARTDSSQEAEATSATFAAAPIGAANERSAAAVTPSSMERVLPMMASEIPAGAAIPCDARGLPR